jgi:beta-ribofuranosylaminobenzene 5'-phosphate synthase
MQLTQCYQVEIESKLPIHVGLGSQTQLSLALAQGLSILEDQKYTINELASLAGRGGTSGIGVAAYEHGGFILDGGHSSLEKPDFMPSHYSNAKPAVLVNRFEVPSDWYFVIAIPDIGEGKSGAAEVEIFKNNCPIPSQEVEKLSRIILMQMLPSIIENDIEQFGSGLTSIQNIGFKRIENQLQNKLIKALQGLYLASGAAGTGLSSFGPATFGLIRTEAAARDLTQESEKFLEKQNKTGNVFYTNANNKGAKIKTF